MTEPATEGMFGSKVRIERAIDFLNQMVIPDYQDFLQCQTDVRRAFHVACSLFHLRDWVYWDFKQSKGWTEKGEVQQFLEGRCDEFRFIRDIANSSKHLRITSAGTPVISAGQTFATITRESLNPVYDSALRYQGGSEVLVTVDQGNPLRFAVIADKVLRMWNQLFEMEGWL
jgi:hypothetical protein